MERAAAMTSPEQDKITAERCRGSLRGGVTPGAGVGSSAAWQHFHDGRMQCAYCRAFVAHDDHGRLVEHSR